MHSMHKDLTSTIERLHKLLASYGIDYDVISQEDSNKYEVKLAGSGLHVALMRFDSQVPGPMIKPSHSSTLKLFMQDGQQPEFTPAVRDRKRYEAAFSQLEQWLESNIDAGHIQVKQLMAC